MQCPHRFEVRGEREQPGDADHDQQHAHHVPAALGGAYPRVCAHLVPMERAVGTAERIEPEIEVTDRIACSLSAGSQQGRQQYDRPQCSEYDQDHQRQDLSTTFVLENVNDARGPSGGPAIRSSLTTPRERSQTGRRKTRLSAWSMSASGATDRLQPEGVGRFGSATPRPRATTRLLPQLELTDGHRTIDRL